MECLAHGKNANKKVEGRGGLGSEISRTSDERARACRSVQIPALSLMSSVTLEQLRACRLASLVFKRGHYVSIIVKV